MKASREDLLRYLESLEPGLSAKALLEQSDCFVFDNGRIMTFNGEIACQQKFDLGFTGAVLAEKLIAVLSLHNDEEIDFEATDGELVIRGKPWEAAITMQDEITLPIDAVEDPGEWKPLNEAFCDGVKMIQQCAGNDQTKFNLTCIHIGRKWVEATDTFQAGRFSMKTNFHESVLIRKSSIKQILDLGMTKFSVTDSWVHFRNKEGLIISCLRVVEEYPDISYMFDIKNGHPTSFPKGLKGSIESAHLFTQDNENDEIQVDLLKIGKIRIKGRSDNGRYKVPKRVRYDGKSITFTIPPKLFMDIIAAHQEFLIGRTRLKVDGGPFQFVTTLGKVDDE